MRLPVSPDAILKEVQGSKEILEKWEKILNEQGVPGIDTQAGEEQLDEFLREMCGELRLVSGKCSNVADVIQDGME